MSQSSNSNMNMNIFSDTSAVTADNKPNSTATERGTKRAAPSSPEGQIKRSMTDHPSCNEQASSSTSQYSHQPKFVSAAAIAASARPNIQMMPEISDEELLQMAIEFEKLHPQ